MIAEYSAFLDWLLYVLIRQKYTVSAQMLEETLDGFAVPLIQTAEVAQ